MAAAMAWYAGPPVVARKGDPGASISARTWTPQGATAWSWPTSASAAGPIGVPGGTRRFRRALARGVIAGADPSTGGQSMPRIVTAGRDQTMSATVPSPSSDTPSRTPASALNVSVEYAAPGHTWVLSSPRTVVLPLASRSVANIATS